MKKLTIATGNRHKTEEFRAFLGADWLIEDLSQHPGIQGAEETGATFAENAELKARLLARQIPGLILADDSGLEVDALRGEPGVRSARFAGEQATDLENVALLLARLRESGARGKQRSGRFRCVLVLARGTDLLGTVEGAVDGIISNEASGNEGFGYDPIFIPEGHCQTFAELGTAAKNKQSHRACALAALRPLLARYCDIG